MVNRSHLSIIVGLILPLAVLAPLEASPREGSARPDELTVARLLPPPVEIPGVKKPPSSPRKKGEGCFRKIPRSRRDRPDRIGGRQVHVVYLLPADARDDRLDVLGTLDCSVKAQDAWFQEASNGLRWRLDTFTYKTRDTKGKVVMSEAIDVTFVRSARPSNQLNGAFGVADDLRSLGFNDPNKRYLSYVASDGGPCGDAIFPIATPGSQSDGQYAQVYLGSDEGCRADDFGVPGRASFSEAIAQQELIHNDGIVQLGAPHGCAAGTPPGMGHVCTGPLVLTEGDLNLDPERVDALYPYVSVPLSEKILDLGNDDYFAHLYPHVVDLKNSPYVEPVP